MPDGMTISIEFFYAFSEEWALALVNAEGNDDEKEYELYGKRVRRTPAVPLSLLDKTSGLRIVKPVRGCHCDHLEVSLASASLCVGSSLLTLLANDRLSTSIRT